MESAEFEFVRPPEAPVFYPTLEEFEDPMIFIGKRRHIIEAAGIARIVPPPEWRPRLQFDMNTTSFTPRLQVLSDLEPKTRIRQSFLTTVLKFHEMQGTEYTRAPTMLGMEVDLRKIYRAVLSLGGYSKVERSHDWATVLQRAELQYEGPRFERAIHELYERWLLAYEYFEQKIPNHKRLPGRSKKPPGRPKRPKQSRPKSKPKSLEVQSAESFPTKKTTKRTRFREFDGPRKICNRCELELPDSKAECVCGFTDFRPYSPPPSQLEVSKEAIDSGLVKIIEPRRHVKHERSQQEHKTDKAAVQEVQDDAVIPRSPTKLSVHSDDSDEDDDKEDDEGSISIADESDNEKGDDDNVDDDDDDAEDDDAEAQPYQLCEVCTRGDDDELMLLCDRCDKGYHTFCLKPPLSKIPKGDWRCPTCLAYVVPKPSMSYGFESSDTTYTMQQFVERSNKFERQYFGNGPPPSREQLEREFWRLITQPTPEEVGLEVEYGADLQVTDVGSGFARIETLPARCTDADKAMSASPWNLNNLPIGKYSLLRHVLMDISGMIVPWIYAGMMFSCFCWHNEDHWSYSINYVHWGKDKTWYGVPGADAEAFEQVMKSHAPELFEAQPDLFHQLVTMLSPSLLLSKGVRVVRTDQKAGEFVVTCPRAYHAGFNTGANLAEAVNFVTWDWLKFGFDSILNYQTTRRPPVFAHDEFLCYVAQAVLRQPDGVDCRSARIVHTQLNLLLNQNYQQRDILVDEGVMTLEEVIMEDLDDDSRQCRGCLGTCYLFALKCSEHPGPLVCLEHAQALCSCPNSSKTIIFRFDPEQLSRFLNALDSRARLFDDWKAQITAILDSIHQMRDTPNTQTKLDLSEIEDLLSASEPDWHTDSDSMLLQGYVNEASTLDNLALDTLCAIRIADGKPSNIQLSQLSSIVESLDKSWISCKAKAGLTRYLATSNELVSKIQEFLQPVIQGTRYSENLDFATEMLIEADIIQCGKFIEEISHLPLEFNQDRATISDLRGLLKWKLDARKLIASENPLILESVEFQLEAAQILKHSPQLSSVILGERSYLLGLLRASQAWAAKTKLLLSTIPEIEVLEAHFAQKPRVNSAEESAILKLIARINDWNTKAAHYASYFNQHTKFQVPLGVIPSGMPLPPLQGAALPPSTSEQGLGDASHASEQGLGNASHLNLVANSQEKEAAVIPIEKPRYLDIQTIISEAKLIPARIPSITVFQSICNVAKQAVLEISNKFLPPRPCMTLVDVLSRRVDISLIQRALQKRAAVSARPPSATPKNCTCVGGICVAFKVNCTVCTNCFHGKYVGLDTTMTGKPERFVCLECNYSRKPSLQRSKNMLKAFEAVPVACDEELALGEAIVHAEQVQNEVDTLCDQITAKDFSVRTPKPDLVSTLTKIERFHLVSDLLPISLDSTSSKRLDLTAERLQKVLEAKARIEANEKASIQAQTRASIQAQTLMKQRASIQAKAPVNEKPSLQAKAPVKERVAPIQEEAPVKKKAKEKVYCLCRRPAIETHFMVQCNTCEDWFHPKCVKRTKKELMAMEKFGCPACHPEDFETSSTSSSSPTEAPEETEKPEPSESIKDHLENSTGYTPKRRKFVEEENGEGVSSSSSESPDHQRTSSTSQVPISQSSANLENIATSESVTVPTWIPFIDEAAVLDEHNALQDAINKAMQESTAILDGEGADEQQHDQNDKSDGKDEVATKEDAPCTD